MKDFIEHSIKWAEEEKSRARKATDIARLNGYLNALYEVKDFIRHAEETYEAEK